MSPVAEIRQNYLGAEHITVLCDSNACTGPHQGSILLLDIHHGYGKNAPPITPEEKDTALTVAFFHEPSHKVRVIQGHGIEGEKINGVSQTIYEHVSEQKKQWASEPHGPFPANNNIGEITVYIAKSERPKAVALKKVEAVQEKFNVEKRLFHILKDQFPGDTVEATHSVKKSKKQEERKIHMFFAHHDAANFGKNTVFAVRVAYGESGIQRSRLGRKKVLAMTSNEWRSQRIVVLNGAQEQETILADFIGQMANLQGKWRSFEALEMYVRQFPEYPQQCFWQAMRKGYFEKRDSLYGWITDRTDASSIIRPIQAMLPVIDTTSIEEASVLPESTHEGPHTA